MLPGVTCPKCGTWATTGLIYPMANVSKLDEVANLTKPNPVTLTKFSELIRALRSVFEDEILLRPGANFGAVQGEARGSFGDFAWCNPWNPLVRESVLNALSAEEVVLVGVNADLRFAGKSLHENLIELDARPCVNVSKRLVPPPCAICGRIGMKVPDRLVLDANTFDERIPIQRVRELPTVLIVNDRFARLILKLELRDVLLQPVEFES